jgi:CRISPR-associated helicase Cas3/CRISPR-associated endonuclease Cas3-HD
MLNIKLLKNYKAKSDNTTIYKHNEDLLIIAQQVKNIYNLTKKEYDKLIKIIHYHDIGKIHKDFQCNINSINRKVRHELLSASNKDLNENEKICILTHHKAIKNGDKMELFNSLNDYYEPYLYEFSQEISIDAENINKLIKTFYKPLKAKNLLHDFDLIKMKGLLQYCDHVASAGIKQIEKGFNPDNNFQFTYLNSIQQKTKELKEPMDILIQAMTGLGKSATSMFWSDIMQNTNKSRRIYYILPYTASINSLYKDFKNREISVGMLHGKAEYFLNKELEDKDLSKNEYNLFKKSIKQITVCTIFQLIKAFFSCKRFEMLLAQMSNSIFIIDEIHCFDIKELALILESLKFLKERFDISICIMSASIPSCLKKVIQDKLNIKTVIEPDNKDLIVRHHINYVPKPIIEDLNKIEEQLDKGKQVLLCVNSVHMAQDLYDKFKEKYNTKLIHGKFNIRDREKAEQNLKTQQLLIGTQAIEVSLDISYDVMFTEIAPLDALLQRFGRVNRKGEKGICEIYIYKDIDNKIYDKKIIENTYECLQKIIDNDKGIIYEDKVNTYLDQVYTYFNYEEYNTYAKQFNNMIDNIMLGYYNNSYGEELFSQDTISVLPIILIDEYKKLIKKYKYDEANSLFVNCNTYYSIYNKELECYITEYKYKADRGLDTREKEIIFI